MTYYIRIKNNDGSFSEKVSRKINIMPNPTGTIQTNYPKPGKIYPVYLANNMHKGNLNVIGTDKYYYSSPISGAAIHMGLIEYSGAYTAESKILYIKYIDCVDDYIRSTRNGIESKPQPCSSNATGFIFVTKDGNEILPPEKPTITTTSGENDITASVTTTTYSGARISKYYYSIDNGTYIESTNSYHKFENVTPYEKHTITAYVKDSNGLISQIGTAEASTTKAIPTPEILIEGTGYKYNNELWYPYNTKITLKYSDDMTNLTGKYITRSIYSEETEIDWTKAEEINSSTMQYTLNESSVYTIIIEDGNGRKSEAVTKKINIMPNIGNNGIRDNYFKYNMGGIYPIYISSGTSISGYVYGTDKYRSTSNIVRSAVHMGLIEYSGSDTTESKMLYIKLIPCPESGSSGSTRNGITSTAYSYYSTYNSFVFVTPEGNEILSPAKPSITAISEENDITVTVTPQTSSTPIIKYYYSIDNGTYIESTNNYYKFEGVTPYVNHTIKAYVKDSNGLMSESATVEAGTTKAIPTPEIIIDGTGHEYNGKMWYPYNTTLILNYSDDMTNLTGKYITRSVNSEETEIDWTKAGTTTSKSKAITLKGSIVYTIIIEDKNGRKSEEVTKEINIMPDIGNSGIPTEWYEDNMGGIYPAYIPAGTPKNAVYGTIKYSRTGSIAGAAMHMGLISYTGVTNTEKTAESKVVYIKLIPCPEGGYIVGTMNGITSTRLAYSSTRYGFIFVTEDGTEITG